MGFGRVAMSLCRNVGNIFKPHSPQQYNSTSRFIDGHMPEQARMCAAPASSRLPTRRLTPCHSRRGRMRRGRAGRTGCAWRCALPRSCPALLAADLFQVLSKPLHRLLRLLPCRAFRLFDGDHLLVELRHLRLKLLTHGPLLLQCLRAAPRWQQLFTARQAVANNSGPRAPLSCR